MAIFLYFTQTMTNPRSHSVGRAEMVLLPWLH